MVASARSALDRELSEIRDHLMRMESLVDTAIERAVRAFTERDVALARQVIQEDMAINDLRFQIEEECLALIATQQPAAGDLRAIIAMMNILVDLERMGDHAAGIAKMVLRMSGEARLKPLSDLPRMAAVCREMLRQSFDAFLARDPELARQAAQRDDEIDQFYQQIFRIVLSYMLEDPKMITQATYMLWAAHNLERIGDRVTNISERVIFMTTGQMKELNVK